jgi:hypothetical protein
MRHPLIIIFLFLGVGVWGSRQARVNTSRMPSSVSGEVIVEKNVVEPIYSSVASSRTIKRDRFLFKRSIDAQLKQTKQSQVHTRPFAQVKYEGHFYLDWLEGSAQKPGRALVSFDIVTGQKRVKSTVPFMIQFSKEWTIASVESTAVKTEQDEDSLSVLKDFISIYAFRTQRDTTGLFEAVYDNQANQISYQKKKYVDAMGASVRFVESKHEIKLDAKTNDLISIIGTERTQTAPKAEGSPLEIDTTTHYSLTRTDTIRVATPRVDGSEFTEVALELKESTVGFRSQTWAAVRAELDQLPSMKRDARLSLFHELTKTLKNNPAKLLDFKAWVAKMKDQPGTLQFAIGVMATLGTEEAQKILVEWFNEIPGSRHAILSALSTSEAKLSPGAQELINEWVDRKNQDRDLAYNAAFVLGSEIRKDPSGAGLLSESKLNRLYEQAAAAANSAEQLVYLDAIGNSGSSAFVSVVERNLASSDEVFREKGVFASRFMKPEVAQSLIVRGLKDPSPRVRISAIKAVSYQPDLAPYRPLLEQYAQGSDEVGSVSRQALEHP